MGLTRQMGAVLGSIPELAGMRAGATNTMRRSDLVQHKENEKKASTRTSQIVFGERQHLLRACNRSGARSRNSFTRARVN